MSGRAEERTVSYYVMLCSIVVAAIVCYGHVSGSRLILLSGLMSFLALVTWAGCVGCSLHVLLFFLPWSPLIKINSHSFALFTFALLIICTICLVRKRFEIRKYQIIVPALIVIESLAAKMIQGNSLSNSYLFFVTMLVLFPCIMDENVTDLSFYGITVFFAMGIVTAALTAQRIAVYPNVAAFITVDSYQMITRLSGFYGDPNFYAAQISACFAGVQILLIHETSKKRRLWLGFIAFLLFYCGMLSASKTFVIVFAGLLLVGTIITLDRENRGSSFLRIMIGMAVAAAIVFSSSEFTRLFQIINERFSFSSNISQITTHRTDLWLMYLNELAGNPLLILFGEGFTNVNLNGRASHNTVIQGVYQFGLTGFPLVIAWVKLSLDLLFKDISRFSIEKKYMFLMAIGVLLPWLSLDIMFFDEFFLLPFYAGCAVIYSSR